MATYLDFEQNIRKIEDDISSATMSGDSHAVDILQKKLQNEVKKPYSNLTDYQKLQLARHADRPYVLDYVKLLMHNYYEIHGDRHFGDDGAIVAYLGYIGEHKVVLIGEQKGRGTKMKLKRNFGMPNPEGYRKALRIAKLGEKFKIPVVMLVDTPGAYPGLGAEERNQSEAIAKNLFELSNLNTPTISIVIGEGGSGGALAIGVADRVAMMRYSVFSVISSEGCAAILWNDPSKVEDATNALKITSSDLKKLGLIDDVIDEPLFGGHRDKRGAATAMADYVIKSLEELNSQTDEDRLQNRYNKLMSYGQFAQ